MTGGNQLENTMVSLHSRIGSTLANILVKNIQLKIKLNTLPQLF